MVMKPSKILINKLKDKGIIDKRTIIDVKPIPGLCSSKFTRIVYASAIEFDKVIILVDGDGDPDGAVKREKQHVPTDNRLS